MFGLGSFTSSDTLADSCRYYMGKGYVDDLTGNYLIACYSEFELFVVVLIM